MGDSHDAAEVCSEQIHVDAPDASSGMCNQTGRSDRPRKAKNGTNSRRSERK